MHNLIDLLEQRQVLWHGRDRKQTLSLSSSGYDSLDAQLDGGLPKKGVMALHAPVGIGELRLLLPTLVNAARLCVFINPPGGLCAEFLHHQGFDLKRVLVINTSSSRESLWAAEQCSKSGACDAVLLWHNMLEVHQVQRLQLACEQGDCRQFIFRSPEAQGFSLPLNLSLNLSADERGLKARVTKRKGGWPVPEFSLDMSAHWPRLTINPSHNIIAFPKSKAI